MAKFKLNIDEIEDDFFTGSRLLGIVSQTKNYRFCWLVNAQFNFNFRLHTDMEIQLRKKGRNYFFDIYYFCEPDSTTEHYIYHNQFEGEYLLPEFKHFDFLWLIKADMISEESFVTLQQEIKKINGIQLVAELMKDKLKNKENLIL